LSTTAQDSRIVMMSVKQNASKNYISRKRRDASTYSRAESRSMEKRNIRDIRSSKLAII
jgi:hypothetical protein